MMPLVSLQAEQSVLSHMLSSDEAADSAIALLRPHMFADDRNGALFQAVTTLREQGRVADEVTVADAVRAHPRFRDGTAPVYVQELMRASPTRSLLMDHAAVIRELASRRAVGRAAAALQAAAGDLSLDSAAIAAQAQRLVESMDEDGASAASPLAVMTGTELFATPTDPPTWLVEQVVMAARHIVLFSEPGLGKSMVARHLMVCRATGRHVFGSLGTQRGVSMYVTAEETVDDLKRGFAIAARGAGVKLEDALPNLRILAGRDTDISLATPMGRRRLEDAVRKSGARLVILDTIAALAGVDLKSDVDVMPLLKWASAMSQRLDVTVMWLAHTTKDREASDLDALFGSRQTSAQVDFAFRLLRGKGGDLRLRCAKARGAPNPGELPLKVEVIANESYALTLESMGTQHLSDQTPAMQEAALKHLAEHPGCTLGSLRSAVAGALGIRAETVGQVVAEMINSGRIMNRGSRARFQLHAAPDACPSMSAHVPDTMSAHRVPMSRPPKGGGIGHGDTDPDGGSSAAWAA